MTCRNISWTQGRKADLICLKFVIVLYNKINFYQLLAAGTNNSPKREINGSFHYTDVIMGMIASQITSLTTIYSDANQRKYQSSASLAFVWGFHRRPVNSPHKGPISQKCFHLMTSSSKRYDLTYAIASLYEMPRYNQPCNNGNRLPTARMPQPRTQAASSAKSQLHDENYTHFSNDPMHRLQIIWKTKFLPFLICCCGCNFTKISDTRNM